MKLEQFDTALCSLVVMGMSLVPAALYAARFVRVEALAGEAIVSDGFTGLVWQGCAAGQPTGTCGGGPASTHAWLPALEYCEGLVWGGIGDWRLPNVGELHSIVDTRVSGPPVDQTAFPATPSGSFFWTSSSRADIATEAWVVNFGSGYVNDRAKADAYLVRCVRGGPFGPVALCGNGSLDAGENCDDGEMICGLCNATCTTVLVPAFATGTITVVARNSMTDGETFTLDDGMNPAVVAELDVAGDGVTAGNVQVDISADPQAVGVRDAIVLAINNQAATLRISASPNATTIVDLIHDQQTGLGNQIITETVADMDFVVVGMSGGAGYDCPSGTGCTDNGDCASGSCTAGMCD